MGKIMRLQKYIAGCGITSRRKAEKMITDGRISVNGEKTTVLGTKVEVGADEICLDGEKIKFNKKMRYIMVNKPRGYVTTNDDQFNRNTVMDLIRPTLRQIHLFPVGRLDYDTEGLLLITNDGDFAQRIMRPESKINKTYHVIVPGKPNAEALKALRNGVKLSDFTTAPAKVKVLGTDKKHTKLEVTIHEGKNREVRRMLEAVGYKVSHLRRVRIGNVSLGNLAPGKWRNLSRTEVKSLCKG